MRRLSWVLLALVCGATRAVASPLFELVGGAQGMGGFNARVTGAGAASTYFNPALLADADQGLELGVYVLSDQIDIDVDARNTSPECPNDTCDIPAVFGTGPESFRHADGSTIAQPAVPTVWLQKGRMVTPTDPGLIARPRQAAGSGHNTRSYQVVGLVSRIFGRRLVLGIHAMIPLSSFTTAQAFYNDEREQYFSNSLHPELYSDRMTATSLAFGAGSRINKKLAVGMSLTLNLENSAQAPVYVSNLADLNTVQLDSDIGVKASVAPHFGVTYRPIDKLQLAATLHTPGAFRIKTGFTYFLATGTEQGAKVDFVHAYMPLMLGLGGTYDIGKIGCDQLSVAATALYARWSQYEDRHGEHPNADYAWSDTLTATLGVRDQHGAVGSFLDFRYQPSPVPAQTGRSNYVDNDKLGAAGGLEYNFTVHGSHFRAGAQLELQRLLARHVTKFATPVNPQPNPNQPGFGAGYYPQLVVDEVPDDAVDGQLGDPIPNRAGLQTNNPGFPGFGSAGWIVGGGVNIAVLY